MGLRPSTDYTDRDFDSIRLRLQMLARSVFPQWTDFNISNFGNTLVDLFAFVLDVLALYQENQAGEAFIATATQRRSLIALAKLLGYSPPSASPAQADVVLSLAEPPIGNVTIPAGATFRTAEVTDPIIFQLLTAVTFLAGMTPPQITATVENSTSYQDVFNSTNLANQEIELAAVPYIDLTAVVVAANGTFTSVSDFLASGSQDKHYTLVVDNSGRAVVRFGNGINGAIPLGTITVDYRTGGGSSGNVEPEAISKVDGSFTDVFGNGVTLSVVNPSKASGGDDRANVEQIRLLAPQTIRVQNRTVSREDYEINALKVPGVARALMTTSNEDVGIGENHGILYIVPKGGGLPSQALKDAVLTMVTVTYPNTLTFQVSVQNPIYLTLNLVMTIFRSEKALKTQAGAAIRSALAAFFAISNSDGTPNKLINFGFYYKNAQGTPDGRIPLDAIFNVVRDLSVVRRMSDIPTEFTINGAHSDIIVQPMMFPVLGTVTIIDGDDGGTI